LEKKNMSASFPISGPHPDFTTPDQIHVEGGAHPTSEPVAPLPEKLKKMEKKADEITYKRWESKSTKTAAMGVFISSSPFLVAAMIAISPVLLILGGLKGLYASGSRLSENKTARLASLASIAAGIAIAVKVGFVTVALVGLFSNPVGWAFCGLIALGLVITILASLYVNYKQNQPEAIASRQAAIESLENELRVGIDSMKKEGVYDRSDLQHLEANFYNPSQINKMQNWMNMTGRLLSSDKGIDPERRNILQSKRHELEEGLKTMNVLKTKIDKEENFFKKQSMIVEFSRQMHYNIDTIKDFEGHWSKGEFDRFWNK
jgi:hypothetical protein